MQEKQQKLLQSIYRAFKYPILLVALLWIIHLVFVVFQINPSNFALVPRRVFGLWGILTSPFLHSDWGHLFNNSFPLLFTGSMMYIFYRKAMFPAIFIIYLGTGLAVWLFGHNGYHIGASGVVYGMVSFIFWSGIFRKNTEAIILSLIVVLLYSGMIVGIFPEDPGISWESHLFGAMMGLLTAISFLGLDQFEKTKPSYSTNQNPEYFFPRDVFEKTRAQRQYEAEQRRLWEQEQDRLLWEMRNNPNQSDEH